ncbi:n-acetyltransferase 9 [Stylonychia lemnae]|uniref:N-acetyltransferase 9 n=1 Tax=Stylonychia lemnae TaxID=5949 RepID=A0A078AIH7_STYLE|nr:n-acetyltransferase 9 [Stylonychia lemnae]|eukprot:CDW82055.1 n-acetyltransferase 9 [Stylonychia lemnae]
MEQTASSTGEKIILVPFLSEMTGIYHKWMLDPFIREMTCTDELDLDEVKSIQKSYLNDSKDLVFLILDLTNEDQQLQKDNYIPQLDQILEQHKDQLIDKIKRPALAGDINLFLQRNNEDLTQGELNVMIAEQKCQRKGLAQEAIKMIMQYGVKYHGQRSFIAKISNTNTSSIELFKKLGFHLEKEIEAFEEVHYVISNKDLQEQGEFIVYNY